MRLYSIRDPNTVTYPEVGGKASDLAGLSAASIPTPDGRGVPTDAIESHLLKCDVERSTFQAGEAPSEEYLPRLRQLIISRGITVRASQERGAGAEGVIIGLPQLNKERQP
jgi:hypothetical protein